MVGAFVQKLLWISTEWQKSPKASMGPFWRQGPLQLPRSHSHELGRSHNQERGSAYERTWTFENNCFSLEWCGRVSILMYPAIECMFYTNSWFLPIQMWKPNQKVLCLVKTEEHDDKTLSYCLQFPKVNSTTE